MEKREATSNSRLESVLQPGTVVTGRYEVVQCLGTGTMGVVYLCRNRDMDGMSVALKVLAPFPSSDCNPGNFLHRFRHEILAMCRVNHVNVVSTYESIFEPDLTAFTMEYVNGGTLNQLLRFRKPLHPHRAANLLIEICAGVEAIHKAGIIHRDIKPENILLTREGQVKITDFGIARSDLSPNITAPGGVVGTVEYLSPQYLRDSKVDAQGDIYAIGVLAFEMITGRAPFKGDNFYQTLEMILSANPTAPKEICKHCPAEFSDIILKAMAREKEDRYQTAEELGQELTKILPVLKELKFESPPSLALDRKKRRNSRSVVQRYNRGRRLRTIAASLLIGLTLPLAVAAVGISRSQANLNSMAVAKNIPPTAQAKGSAKSIAISSPKMVEAEFTPVIAPVAMRFEDAGVHAVPVVKGPAVSQAFAPIPGVSSIEAARFDDAPRAMLKLRSIPEPKVSEPAPVKSKQAESPGRGTTGPIVNKPIVKEIPPAPKAVVAPPETIAKVVSAPSDQPLPSMEYRVRATLLYRFADYVTWPGTSFDSSTASLKICIVGRDPFGGYIDQQVTRARQHGGRPFEVTRLPISANAAQLASCHILYSASTNATEVERLFKLVEKTPVLTVSEISGVGVIDFVMREEKVKFEIDLSRAESSNLTLGSMLLDLALRD